MVEIGQVKCDDENSRQSSPNLAPSEIVGAHVEPQLSVEVFKRKRGRPKSTVQPLWILERIGLVLLLHHRAKGLAKSILK
jgi:hypothetical protein